MKYYACLIIVSLMFFSLGLFIGITSSSQVKQENKVYKFNIKDGFDLQWFNSANEKWNISEEAGASIEFYDWGFSMKETNGDVYLIPWTSVDYAKLNNKDRK